MDFFFLKNLFFELQNINSLEDLTFHLVNIYFIFLIIFFFFFNKKLLINLLIFLLKNIKMVFIFIYIYFSGNSYCSSRAKRNSSISLSKIKKKKLRYRLKKKSFFLKTLLDLKKLKKVFIRDIILKKKLKNFKLPDFFYRTWWDLLITGKKTFSTMFLLNKEFSIFKKNIRNKEKILYKLYREYNIYYRKKIEDNFYRYFTNLNQLKFSLNRESNKKLNNFKKNLFLYKKLHNKNILLNQINTSIKLRFKNVKSIAKEKPRKKLAFIWLRNYIFKNQKFLYKSMNKKPVKEIQWISPNDPIMRNNMISYIKFHSRRFYLIFLYWSHPFLHPLASFYYSYKYPLWAVILCIIFLYIYNNQFRDFIKKHDTKKIQFSRRKYNFEDMLILGHLTFIFLVYLWYFTINETLSIQMLYLTALMFFSAKIYFYYRFQKNPPKYK
jgi:hypothetical protein